MTSLGHTDIIQDDSSVTETSVKIRNGLERLQVVQHGEDGETDAICRTHDVLAVKLVDGNRYILDIAGAQFGQYRTVLSAEEFKAQWVEAIVKEVPFGAWAGFWPDWLAAADSTTKEYHMIACGRVAGRVQNRLIKTWEQQAGSSVTQLLNEKGSAHQAGIKELVELVATQMAPLAKKEIDDTGLPPVFRLAFRTLCEPGHMGTLSDSQDGAAQVSRCGYAADGGEEASSA